MESAVNKTDKIYRVDSYANPRNLCLRLYSSSPWEGLISTCRMGGSEADPKGKAKRKGVCMQKYSFYTLKLSLMPRPTTKQQLLELADQNYKKLIKLIDSFTPAQQEGKFPFEDRDQNIKDVLVHLYERHQLLLNREKSNMQWKKADFLLPGYTRKTYPQMNIKFREQHQTTTLPAAKKLLEASHHQVIAMLSEHSDAELFTKKFYSWTGTSSLGTYAISATSSHYDWAMKKIKRYQKEIVT